MRDLELTEALQRFFHSFPAGPVRTERVSLLRAAGRVTAKALRATADSPPFTRATVDGYAVRSKDMASASPGAPVRLRVVGRVMMGRVARPLPASLVCIEVPTGGMLPSGADAVLMQEEVKPEETGRHGPSIIVARPVPAHAKVSFRGEEIQKGTDFLPAGTRLTPDHLSLIAEFGYRQVPVAAPPRVAVVSTGNELVGLRARLTPARIRDRNSVAMAVLVVAAGGLPRSEGIVRDDFRRFQLQLRAALRRSDLVLVTGGTAVGRRDFTAEVFQSLGRPGVLVNGVRVRNGRPVVLAVVGKKPLIGLPGYPPGAITCFDLVVRPALARLMGQTEGEA